MSIVRLWPCLLVGACAGAGPAEASLRHERTRAAIVHGDPLFGGGAFVEQRLVASPAFVAIGDPSARAEFLREVRQQADAAAVALAHELVTVALAADVHDFVASPACATLWAAQGFALAACPVPVDDFAAQTTEAYGDPAWVGVAATQRVRELAEGTGQHSISPARLAIVLGAMRVQPEAAEAIAAFAATSAGARWLAVRDAALAQSQASFQNVLAAARVRGFVRDVIEGPAVLDTALPKTLGELFDQPVMPLAFQLTVDAAGVVRCEGVDLANVAATDELRKALRRLRERGLAAGRLSVVHEMVGAEPVPCIDEPIGVSAVEGVPWRHVAALLALLSGPELAFWKVQLDVDPKIVPESMREPGGR